MTTEAKWKVGYQKEIERAISSRKAGNEGMARVCARRAAGIVIGEYLSRQGNTNLSNSTIERISIFVTLPGMDDNNRDIARHFLLKVNADRNLPNDVDLISDNQWLVMNLLLENTD